MIRKDAQQKTKKINFLLTQNAIPYVPPTNNILIQTLASFFFVVDHISTSNNTALSAKTHTKKGAQPINNHKTASGQQHPRGVELFGMSFCPARKVSARLYTHPWPLYGPQSVLMMTLSSAMA